MARMVKWIVGTLAVLAVAGIAIFVGYGSWQTYLNVDRLLTVGGETAQNSGWPEPETAADIGFVGDPMTAYGFAFEDVAIPGELGPIPAWLVRPEGAAAEGGTWAIIVHGIGGRRENGYRFLPTFRAAGIPTLMMSYRNDEGAPPSGEGRYAFGLTEWRDLDAAARLALGKGAQSLVLLGESMGGGIVGQFLRQSDLRDRVSAVVLDAAAIEFKATLAATLTQLKVPLPSLMAEGGLFVAAKKMPFDLRKADVTGEFAAFAGPMFISHGEADRIVPVALSDRLAERRNAPTEYLRTRADHILSWKEDPARYDAALLGFLKTLP